jgi:hypothetical protein
MTKIILKIAAMTVLSVFVSGCTKSSQTNEKFVIEGSVTGKQIKQHKTVTILNKEGFQKLFAFSCVDAVLVDSNFNKREKYEIVQMNRTNFSISDGKKKSKLEIEHIEDSIFFIGSDTKTIDELKKEVSLFAECIKD